MKNTCKTNYSWKNQTKNYIKLYKMAIKEGRYGMNKLYTLILAGSKGSGLESLTKTECKTMIKIWRGIPFNRLYTWKLFKIRNY